MPCAEISKFMIAEELPYWSMPPPCWTLPDTEYAASTSSMKPRACSAREMVRGKPVNEGCRKAQADRGRALGIAEVGNRALREVGLDREVGAVVDLVVADQRLGEHHPDRALHA